MGIFGAIGAFSELLEIEMFFIRRSLDVRPGATNFLWPVLGTWLLFFLVTATFAGVLLVRTDWIVGKLRFPEDPAKGIQPSQFLRVGLILLGVFALIDAVSRLGSAIFAVITLGFTPGVLLSEYGSILSPVLKLILTWLLIRKSERFAQLVFPIAPNAA